MDKIKRYLECYIDTETCNFRCGYCYIAQKEKFKNKICKFKKTPEEIRNALSKERLGGTCLINFCAGGETLLSEDVIPVIKALLEEGHYLMVVTNGSLTGRFKELMQFPESLKKRLIFKMSFHYLELKRLKMLDVFVNNVNQIKNGGASYTIEITPSDELMPYIDELKTFCLDHFGALCHTTIAREDISGNINHLSQLSFEDYIKTWSVFESNLLNFKKDIFYKKRKEFCYAGDWSIYINLTTGDYKQCYSERKIGNIYNKKPLKFCAIGNRCKIAHCYNGHAFLTLGTIPEMKTPTYASLRDRNECWLQPEMREFISSKLVESNKEYSRCKKFKTNCVNFGVSVLGKCKRGVKKIFKGNKK